MSVLVTGGGGYIGSVIVRLLCNEGLDVVVLDNFESGYRQSVDGRATVIEADLRDLPKTLKALEDENSQFEAVFHMASSIVVSESQNKPLAYYENNVIATYNLLQAIRGKGIKRFIFSSSAAVYSEKAEMPLHEDSLLNPSSCYGSTKLACESMIKWAAQELGFKPVIFRYFNASGGYEELRESHVPETHLIPLMIRAYLNGEPMKVFGGDYPTADGTAIRDYIHVYDIAKAHLMALDLESTTMIFNLGTEQGISVLEVLAAAESVIGKSIKREIVDRRAGDASILIADAKLAKKELGWIPECSDIREIIATSMPVTLSSG